MDNVKHVENMLYGMLKKRNVHAVQDSSWLEMYAQFVILEQDIMEQIVFVI